MASSSSAEVAPPPPRPPPLLQSSSFTAVKYSTPDVNNRDSFNPAEKITCLRKWFPELEASRWLNHYRHSSAMLQDGPQCGLVALCLAAQTLNVTADVDKLFLVAKEKSFTLQGEMFSAENMAQLARDFGLSASVVSMETHVRDVIVHLMNGKPVLVPYDSDGNFAPCLKNGHKAHWAVLTGIVLLADNVSRVGDKYEINKSVQYVYDAKEVTFVLDDLDLAIMDVNHIFVFARQGKSRHVGLWSLANLISSNKNLRELDPVRAQDISSYVLPPGGVEQGLNDKAVIVSV